MYHTYILQSGKNGAYYIGSTSDISRRLAEHNSGKVRSTKTGVPWDIYYVEAAQDRKTAILRERRIKSWKSRSMIEKLRFKEVADPRFCNPDNVGSKIGTESTPEPEPAPTE